MSSAATVNLEIGPGLIIIASVSLICVSVSLILSRSDGSAKYAGLGLIPFAIFIDVVLWFAPRADLNADENNQDADIKYDPNYVSRIVVLAVLVVFFIASLLLYVVFQLLEPIYAKPLKKNTY